MKPRRRSILLAWVAIAVLLAAWPLATGYARLRDWMRAEPLHLSVWQLAGEMKRFSNELGRAPVNFDQLQRFASQRDFADLRAYRHEFRPRGPVRFVLWANSRFAFTIDDQFEVAWTSPEKVDAPASP